jgi:hypothetical protein
MDNSRSDAGIVHHRIAVMGRARTGKDTFANIVVENFPGTHVVAFSDAVYALVDKLRECVWGGRPDLIPQHILDVVGLQIYVDDVAEFIAGVSEMILNEDPVAPGKNPALLIYVAETLKVCLHADIWVNITMNKINDIIAADAASNIIVTGVRFPNEYDALSGFTKVRIIRRGRIIDRDPSTENALDQYPVDYEINNDGSLRAYRAIIEMYLDCVH